MRALFVFFLAVPTALGPRAPATGTDLDTLRARAQEIADHVSSLEHKLEGLNYRGGRLAAAIDPVGQDMALSYLDMRDADSDYDAAREVFIERAIEAYKAGSGDRLELILSASDMRELELAAQINSRIAATESEALIDLQQAQAEAEKTQTDIEERKARLLLLNSRIEGVRSEVAETIGERRATLRSLTVEIERLEAQARAAAALAAPSNPGNGLGGPAPDVPDDFIGTGVSFEGVASWYGPGFEGNPTASGAIFDPMGFTAASRDLPLGTWLHVVFEGKGVVVEVNDRGPFIDGRILDLSQGAAQAIGITGLGWIDAEIIVEK